MGKAESPRGKNFSSLSLLAGKVVALFGAGVTFLWLTGIGTDAENFFQIDITRPLTGVCFLLSGFALWVISEYGTTSPADAAKPRISSLITAAKISSDLVIVVSIVSILQCLFGFDLHLDEALVGPFWKHHVVHIYGEMTLLTALAFLSTGLVIPALDIKLGNRIFPGELLALAVLAVSLDAFITFLYIGPAGSLSDEPMSIITTLAFMMLSIGGLAVRKDRGLMAIWTANYDGSKVLSKWLPLEVGVFVVAGGIIDYLRYRGFLTRPSGFAVFAISMITFATVAAFLAAISLNKAERKLLRSNRLYDTLSQTNEALVRTGDIALLLKKVCRIFIERGRLSMAWSGLYADSRNKLRLVACAGEGSDDFVAAVSRDDLSNTAGVREVLAGADYARYDNIESELTYSAVRENLLERGIKSLAVLPLKKSGNVAGAFAVYSDEANFFQEAEIKLLAEVSLDLSFALDEMRRKEEKEAAEKAAKQADELYKKFFDEDLTADFIADSSGRLKSFNPAYLRIFGFTDREEALGSNVAELYPSPEMRREFIRALTANKKLEYYEHFLKKKDGTPIYIVENAFGTFNEAGELVETKHYMFDDTRRKTLEQELIQGKKMESLGTLAGGIAHDFNNLLAIILGYTSLLTRRKVDKAKLTRSTDAITDAANRGVGLVRQLLTFARKGERVVERLRLNDIISDLSKLLEETFPKPIDIRLSLMENLPLVLGDQTQIHQSLINLCVNARDAMIDRKDGKPAGGVLRIVSTVTSGDTLASEFPNATSGEYVQVSISDTGMGIDEATLGHIFEPFFTTKEPGKGTGLGLATVYGIVQGHEGFINAASVPGVGTTFSIFLPVAPTTADDIMNVEISRRRIKGGHETILIVEDEETLRELLHDTLKSVGYDVLTAPDGDRAIREYRKRMDSIKLVVSDIGLPGLGGIDMLKELKKVNPDVRVIFASGFIEAEVKSDLLRAGALDFIEKPYLVRDIAARIRDCLDRVSAARRDA